MVRFPRIGNRGSKIALYTGFSTLLIINGFILVRALNGDPIKLEGFETKEIGRETVRQAIRPGTSYEDVKRRLIEKKKRQLMDKQEQESDLDLKQMAETTSFDFWNQSDDDKDDDNDDNNENDENGNDENMIASLNDEMNRMNQLFEVKIRQAPSIVANRK